MTQSISKRLLAYSAVLLLGLSGQLFASQCPTDNVVTDPAIFQWTHHPVSANNAQAYYSGSLEMGEVTFTIGGETLTTRAYRQANGVYSIPGPTILMKPGNTYVLRFNNTLPYEAPSSEHNVFKDPNITNVHTHGLHISGESPADDVTRMFEGGFGGDYVYDIPEDHMGGTYWYHAHHHGSTFLQVSSGAFGLIIIDDANDQIPTNVANMQEKHLVMGYLDPTSEGTGGDTLVSGTLSAGWTVNGKVNGNICMPTNTWQHWRVLIADRDARLTDLEIGPQCEVALMSRDGVWRTEVPKMISDNTLTLTGASRAGLAVRCSGDADVSVGGKVVARIYADGASDASVHPYAEDGVATWSAQRPAYLRDLRGLAVTGTETIRLGARSVLGSKFDADVPNLSVLADGIQEWILKGATNHPFHLHIYHLQVIGDCGSYEDGEYYDVVAGNCKVRFDLSPVTSSVYAGRTIMHCHVLAHEDLGAMGWMDVIGGMPPPLFPLNGDVSPSYQEYYATSDGVVEDSTDPIVTGTTIVLGSITLSTGNAGKGYKFGIATINVIDDQGNSVADAIVSGEFSGDLNEIITSSHATDGSGNVSIETSASIKRLSDLTFCVTAIRHDSLDDLLVATGALCSSL